MATDVKTESSSSIQDTTNFLAKPMKRSNKPAMEKRRRERINNSLEILKKLVLDALKKDTSQYSKLEKADILEMTVKHLRSLQSQQLHVAAATDNGVVSKYHEGFSECAQEVGRYLNQVDGLHPQTKGRLLQHLTKCVSGSPSASPVNPCILPASSHQHLTTTNATALQTQSLQVTIPQASTVSSIPAATPISSLPGAPSIAVPSNNSQIQHIPILNTISPQTAPQFLGAFQMVPAAPMSRSDVTFLLSAAGEASAPVQNLPVTSPTSLSPAISHSSSLSSNRTSPSSSMFSRLSPSSSSSSSQLSSAASPVSFNPPVSKQQISSYVYNNKNSIYSQHMAAYQHHMSVNGQESFKPVAPSFNAPVNMQMKEEKVWRPW